MGFDYCSGCDDPYCSGKTEEQTIECLEKQKDIDQLLAIINEKIDELKKLILIVERLKKQKNNVEHI